MTPGEKGKEGAAGTLAALSSEYWDYWLRARPQFATYLGVHRYDDRLPDLSAAGRDADRRAHGDLLRRLRAVPLEGLTLEDRLTASALGETLEMGQAEPDQKIWQWQIDQLMGPQVWFLELLNTHPLRNAQDYDNLLARMAAYPGLLDQYLEGLREGTREGRFAPEIAVSRVIHQLGEVLALAPEAHPLAQAIPRMPAAFDAATRERLSHRLLEAIRSEVTPALERMRTYLERDYLSHARREVGASAMPGGRELYAWLVRFHTTTRLSAAEIHRTGLEEMAAIRAEMRALADRMGFVGELADFLAQVRSDPKNMAGTREAVLARYQQDLDRAARELPRFFARLPRAACIIKPLEEFREKDAPAAYYYGPAEDGSRPGVFWANTYRPETRPLVTATSLTAHEAVPGHHLQVALAMELSGLPDFRRHSGFTAYVEGWALYAERLADEMGLYEDPVSRVGMLTDQGLRACRLVVDTGMHEMGWTRERAVDYMRTNLAMRDQEIINEIDRYIVWPAQALAYKVGQREISRLRAEAERALGARFDIRGFHGAILEHGALPLTTLPIAVETWVASVPR